MIPAIGMIAMPCHGIAPVANTTTSTGTTPAAIASAAHGQARSASTRRPVVSTPIENITATSSQDSARLPTTALISSATTASWATARTAATSDGSSRP